MSRKVKDPTAISPPNCEQPIRKEMRVDRLKVLGLLLNPLTPALCDAVFPQHRPIERTRTWPFDAVTLFWAARIVRPPRALQQGLDQTRKGRGRDKGWPRVMATPRAFFTKAQGLRPHLFRATDEAFTARFLPPPDQPLPRGWAGAASPSPTSSSWTVRVWMRLATG